MIRDSLVVEVDDMVVLVVMHILPHHPSVLMGDMVVLVFNFLQHLEIQIQM